MASSLNIYKFLLRVLLANLFLNFASGYIEYTFDNDKICSAIKKKRKIKLGYNERSGLLLQETPYYHHWPGSHNFDCHFKVEGISKDGIMVVIQNMSLRKNETTGECIDYIEFKQEEGEKIKRFCGKISVNPGPLENPGAQAPNTFVDFKGELEVILHIKKVPVEPGETIDMNVVFTAFKLCTKNTTEYSSCGSELCMWDGFFNDGMVNCPFGDCKDEPNCIVNANGIRKVEKSKSNVWKALGIVACCTLFLVTCLYMVFHKRGSAARHHRPQDFAVPDVEQRLSPSAPPLQESPSRSKDKPPSYDSLFPSN